MSFTDLKFTDGIRLAAAVIEVLDGQDSGPSGEDSPSLREIAAAFQPQPAEPSRDRRAAGEAVSGQLRAASKTIAAIAEQVMQKIRTKHGDSYAEELNERLRLRS